MPKIIKNILVILYLVLMIITGEAAGFYLNLLNKEITKPNVKDNHLELNTLKFYNSEKNMPISPTAPNNILALIKALKAEEKTQNILFVGDLMFDRNVEALMNKNGADYPFEKINKFLQEGGLIVANLEGPIVAQPKNFGEHALQFAFAKETGSVLADNYINLVSLGNNHVINMGQEGLKETKEYLTASQINYFGDPLKCSADFAYSQDNLLFLGFNKTFSSGCPDQDILNGLKEARLKNPDKFIIVNMHWGKEYQLQNTKAQQTLAYELIDNGADLIIGHHPHVVGNIELYKNKLIFYSLGNFIFDQYFSKNVQQGLAIGLEIDNHQQIYTINPIQSAKSQPSLMAAEDKAKFLTDLAGRSSKELNEQILLGKIELQK